MGFWVSTLCLDSWALWDFEACPSFEPQIASGTTEVGSQARQVQQAHLLSGTDHAE